MESLLTGEALSTSKHRACVQKSSREKRENKEEREEAQLNKKKRIETNKGQQRLKRATVAGAWITVVPELMNGTTLSTEDFRDTHRIHFGLQPQDLRQICYGCGEN